jgi:hypothetical protein
MVVLMPVAVTPVGLKPGWHWTCLGALFRAFSRVVSPRAKDEKTICLKWRKACICSKVNVAVPEDGHTPMCGRHALKTRLADNQVIQPAISGTSSGVRGVFGPAVRGCRWRLTPGYWLSTLRVGPKRDLQVFQARDFAVLIRGLKACPVAPLPQGGVASRRAGFASAVQGVQPVPTSNRHIKSPVKKN